MNSQTPFVSSIGLFSGEKNTKQRTVAMDDWGNVDWFLHTWGFLPNDFEKISTIEDKKKDYLILLLLDICWRKCDDKMGEFSIKKVQDFLAQQGEGFTKYFDGFVPPPDPMSFVQNRVIKTK